MPSILLSRLTAEDLVRTLHNRRKSCDLRYGYIVADWSDLQARERDLWIAAAEELAAEIRSAAGGPALAESEGHVHNLAVMLRRVLRAAQLPQGLRDQATGLLERCAPAHPSLRRDGPAS